MTPTDEITDEMQDHQERCQAHQLRLRMVARGEPDLTFPLEVVAEVAEAATAIIAEAEAGALSVGAAALHSLGGRGAGTFLRVRLDRLAAAADDAIAAAQAGNSAEMRRYLHRFDTLTSAIWTVQRALYRPGDTKDLPE
jgi:hypothetical protein